MTVALRLRLFVQMLTNASRTGWSVNCYAEGNKNLAALPFGAAANFRCGKYSDDRK